MGKLHGKELKKLLSCIKKDLRVIVPPISGYDAGVHLLGDKHLVVATDPCIGVPAEWFGWLLINYAASDVALFSAKPEFCTVNLLGPPAIKPDVFQSIMQQACRAADELGMAIVRGHTGTYDGVTKLLGVCTAYGTVQKESLITPADAKPGDLILCTKSVGLETLVNFSLTRKSLARRILGAKEAANMASLVKMESCVQEALTLAEINGIHAMHDATEGGLATALNEMAEASRLGFEIEFEKLPISSEMKMLQEGFRLSDEEVLSTSSTGTVLAAVKSTAKRKVGEALREIGVSASFIGTFTKNKKRELVKDGRRKTFPKVADDPYGRILSGKV
jgi:hydrogenase maturation factor